MERQGILIVVSGFSGSGKSTITRRAIRADERYALSVSVTTREPRGEEMDGVDYHFITHDEFERMIEADDLYEYALYNGNYYGTPRSYVEESLAAGRDVLLEIEVQGAELIRKIYPDSVHIFITPPSVGELVNRLRDRGTESKEKIAGRLARAKEEAAYVQNYDYLLVNNDLEESVRLFKAIIDSEHHRCRRNTAFIEEIATDLATLDVNTI